MTPRMNQSYSQNPDQQITEENPYRLETLPKSTREIFVKSSLLSKELKQIHRENLKTLKRIKETSKTKYNTDKKQKHEEM